MTKAHLGIVAAALGLISYARAQGIDLGSPGRELLAAIERERPGTIAGFDAICPEPASVGKSVKDRNHRFLNRIRKGPKVPSIEEIQAHTKLVHHAKRLG